jgi:hypothetical protein
MNDKPEITCAEYWRKQRVKQNIDAAVSLFLYIGIPLALLWWVLA